MAQSLPRLGLCKATVAIFMSLAIAARSQWDEESECNKKIDLLIMLDDSDSIEWNPAGFRQLKQFVGDLVEASPGTTQVSLVQWSGDPQVLESGFDPASLKDDYQHVVFDFNTFAADRAAAVDIIRSLKIHFGAQTDIPNALRYAAEYAQDGSRGWRGDANKVVLFITDGITNPGHQPDRIPERAQQLGNEATVFVLGVTGNDGLNQTELLEIVQGDRSKRFLETFDALEDVLVAEMNQDICMFDETECSKPLDLLLMVDDSDSIEWNPEGFEKLKIFLADTVDALPAGSHVSLVQWSGDPIVLENGFDPAAVKDDYQHVVFDFNKHGEDRFGMIEDIENLKIHFGAQTDIPNAMRYATEYAQDTSRGWRDDALKVILIVTDGITNPGHQPALIPEKAQALAAQGTVLALGVTGSDGKNEAELLGIVEGNDARLFTVEDFDGLQATLATAISREMC